MRTVSSQGLGERGFSMVEVMLSMVLFSIITGTITILLLFGVKGAERVISHEETLSQARYSVQRMAYELLKLKTADITAIAPGQLDYKDSGGVTTSYRLATVGGVTQVLRGSDILVPKASALSFNYLDGSGNETSTIANIRRIQWTMTIPEAAGGSFTLTGTSFLRSSYYASFR